jgi:hypothetical protein
MCTPSRRLLSRTFKLASSTGAIAAVLALAGTAWSGEGPKKDDPFKNDEVFKLTHVIQVPGAAAFFSFDISFYDPVLNRYFLADRNNKSVDIIDPSTNSLTVVVNNKFQGFTGNNDTSGPDGLATVNNHTEIWVGDVGGTCTTPPDPNPLCGPGQVWVLNTDASLKTLPVANPISVGGTTRADEFCTDTKNNVVMIASPAESPPFVTFISTTSYKVLGQLIFDGGSGAGHAPLKATNGLEQCGFSPVTGKLYQNVPAVNGPDGKDTVPGAVAVINGKTMAYETSFSVPIADCAGPQGMAIGPDSQILLGCNAASIPGGHRNVVVIDANNGTVLKTIADLGGADEVWFNPGDGHYIIPSCNTPCRTVPVTGAVTGPELLGIVDSNGLRLDHSVTVAFQNSDTTVLLSGNPRTIHSAAANSKTNEIYLPIPAVGGQAPQFDPTLCDSFGEGITRTGSPSAATGCIVILKAKHDDRPKVAKERDNDDRQD